MARLTSSLKLQLRPLYLLKVNTMNQITQDYLVEHFDYKDGQLIRKTKMGLPSSLRDLGIDKSQYSKDLEDIMDLVEKDICTEYNPRKFNRVQLKELLENLY